ncbi:15060_t:CDS:2, partial [Funneliformis mosseae]
ENMLENTDAECSCPYAFEDIKKYFELVSKRDFVPSLSEFVRKNTNLLVRSPPEVNDFKSLDGAWKKRFTTVAKILNMEESISIFSFSAFMTSQSDFALVLWIVRNESQSDVVKKLSLCTKKNMKLLEINYPKTRKTISKIMNPIIYQDDESTTAKRNKENHNKHTIASDTLQINCLCYTFATLLIQLFELVSNLTKNKITALKEQFEAPGLIDSPITPSSYTGTNVDLVLKKSQATEHQVHPPEYTENPSENTMCDGYSTTLKQYEIDIEKHIKRKTNEDDNDDELLENAKFLFNELNEELLIDKPCILGNIGLKKESLNNSGIKNKEIEKLSQNFSNKIRWTDDEKQDAESPKGVYRGRTEDVDNSSVIFWHFYVRKYQKHLVNNLIFSFSDNIMISNLFLCTISSNIRGKIQAISTNKARNENANPFSRAKVRHKVDMKGTLIKTPSKFKVIYEEVSRGLATFGIPASCPKKQYVDKVKLMIMLRDSFNQFFKDNRHVKNKQCKELTVYEWLQIGKRK